jgi:hypothetical protein
MKYRRVFLPNLPRKTLKYFCRSGKDNKNRYVGGKLAAGLQKKRRRSHTVVGRFLAAFTRGGNNIYADFHKNSYAV